jgi:hypothetical protein
MNLSRFVNYSLIFAALLAVCLSLTTASARAQSIPTDGTALILTAANENPLPNQAVSITATSYSFDIDSATLVWSIGDKEIQKGIGLTTFQATAPALGKKTTIQVTAITTSGTRYSNSITLGSGSMDMITESDGYTPPFFKGKIPFVFENVLKVIAVPHLANSAGVEYDPASLVYQWKKDDGTVLQDQSGYGKQSITLKGELIPRPYYLIVTASTRDGSAQAQSLIQISGSSPFISFYREDPVYGPLFNRAMSGSVKIASQKETKVFASLYGFNFGDALSDSLTVDWMINGIEHSELASSKSVVLRAPDGSSGSSYIQLGVRGVDNILQAASKDFNVSFDASAPSRSSTSITI